MDNVKTKELVPLRCKVSKAFSLTPMLYDTVTVDPGSSLSCKTLTFYSLDQREAVTVKIMMLDPGKLAEVTRKIQEAILAIDAV